MTKPFSLTKNLFFLLFVTVFLFTLTDPALALNVEKIGKGLVGSEREKILLLKNIAFYAGLFFAVLGMIVIVFIKSKFALQKRSDTSNATGPFLIVFGSILMLVKFI